MCILSKFYTTVHVSFGTTQLVAIIYTTILKIQAVLAEKIEWNIYVNQKNLLPIYTYWLNINFVWIFFVRKNIFQRGMPPVVPRDVLTLLIVVLPSVNSPPPPPLPTHTHLPNQNILQGYCVWAIINCMQAILHIRIHFQG